MAMRRSDHLSARDIPSLAACGRHRRRHGRDELFLPADDCQDIPRTYGHGASGSNDATAREHPLTLRGREEVHLVLDGKTEAPDGISVMAAYPHATSTIAVRTAAARKP